MSIKDFSWEIEDDGSTLDTEETEQQQLVYITSLKDDLQKNITKLYEEEGSKDKNPAVKNKLFEKPSIVNLSHVSELFEESGCEDENIEKNEKGKNQATLKSMNTRKERKLSY